MRAVVTKVKLRTKRALRRITGGKLISDLTSMMQTFVGTFCPCFSGIHSAKYESLTDDMATNDHNQDTADRVGNILMYFSVVAYILLIIKFSVKVNGVMDDYQRNLPLLLYGTILEVLICGASARAAALMYKRRRHVRKHPNVFRKSEYIKVGPISRTDCRIPWGFSYIPAADGIEALLVEDIYSSSLTAEWNARFDLQMDLGADEEIQAAPDGVFCIDDEEGQPLEDDTMNPVPVEKNNKVNLTKRPSLVDINLSIDTTISDSDEAADEMPPIKKGKLYYGLAIVGVNEVHGDIGPMQVEMLTAETVIFYCHLYLGDPTMDDDELLATKPEPTTFGLKAKDDVTGATEAPENKHDVSVVGLEDEEPQMLMRWVLWGFSFGFVTLLPVVLLEPHEERPRQAQFRNILGVATKVILSIWIVMWLTDTAAILLHGSLFSPFTYYVSVHMVMAGVLVMLGMKLQANDTELVLEQRRIRKEEVDAKNDEENYVRIRSHVAEDPSPTLLRELLISNPIAIIFIGSMVAIPLVIGQKIYPLKTERGKLAQQYVIWFFGALSFLQVLAILFLWQIHSEQLPRMYLAGFAALIWYPCLFAYCICLICSGQYAKRDFELCQQQRIIRAGQCPESSGEFGTVEVSEGRGTEWELCYSC